MRYATAWAVAALLGVLAAAPAAQSPTARTMLEAARKVEVVDGDLKGAIERYQKIVDTRGIDRAIAAEALVRIAGCYQKLGDAQARVVYQRVVREFSDQTAAVAEARAHLGQDNSGGSRTTSLRRIWTGPEVAYESCVSADGRYISYPAWATGDLGLHDVTTGTNRLLTNNNYANTEYAQGSSISPDSRQVAYAWFNGRDHYQLRVLGVDGTASPRTILDDPSILFLAPFDWLPDGRSVSVWVQKKDATSQIGVVSLVEGSLRIVKTLDWRGSLRLSVTPDGKYIAYDAPTSTRNSNERDVFIIGVDAKGETAIISAPGRDQVVGWSPDGRTLLFASDRSGTLALWSQPVVNGRAQGAPALIKPDFSNSSIGITRSGALFTLGTIGGEDVKTVSADLESGKILSAPESVVRSFVGANRMPVWSPDGQQLAYFSRRGIGGRDYIIVIKTLATGQTRELTLPVISASQFKWTPDGRGFVLAARDLSGREGHYRIDGDTGALTLLAAFPAVVGVSFPELSSDGRKLYFWTGEVLRGTAGSRFVEHDVATGAERTLWSGPGGPLFPALSPDDRWFAGIVRNPDQKSGALVLRPASGEGDSRELLRLDDWRTVSGFVTWSADSRKVIVTRQRGSSYQPFIVPVAGGSPQALDLETSNLGIKVHPDNRQLTYGVGRISTEVWVLENFLPPASAARRP